MCEKYRYLKDLDINFSLKDFVNLNSRNDLEAKVLNPQLEQRGYKVIKSWYWSEMFNTWIRASKAEKDGEVEIVWYST